MNRRTVVRAVLVAVKDGVTSGWGCNRWTVELSCGHRKVGVIGKGHQRPRRARCLACGAGIPPVPVCTCKLSGITGNRECQVHDCKCGDFPSVKDTGGPQNTTPTCLIHPWF